MKCGFIVLSLVMLLKGYLCGKRKGLCNSTHVDKPVDDYMKIITINWKFYGYIESGAPYRNPFSIPYNEYPQCSNMRIETHRAATGHSEIDLNFECRESANAVSPCQMIEFVNNNTVRFNYEPMRRNPIAKNGVP